MSLLINNVIIDRPSDTWYSLNNEHVKFNQFKINHNNTLDLFLVFLDEKFWIKFIYDNLILSGII